MRPGWTWGGVDCEGVGNIGKGGVGRCDDGGAESGGLYPTWGTYEARDCCGRLVDRNEPVEIDAVESVGAGEADGPGVKLVGADV